MARKIVAWTDQGENDQPIRKWATVAQVIQIQKEAVGAMGHTYKKDYDALMDFLTVNWAGVYESTHLIEESDCAE